MGTIDSIWRKNLIWIVFWCTYFSTIQTRTRWKGFKPNMRSVFGCWYPVEQIFKREWENEIIGRQEMIAMIVANRNDWLWENHLSDWSGGNGSLWHWRGTSEGHEWGQQSNTIASQVQVHPTANTNTPRRTHKSIQSQNASLWSYEITSEGHNWASTRPIAPKQLENQQVALLSLLFHSQCTGLLVLISTTVHCWLCGAGIIHKCHLLAWRVGGAPSGAPQQDSMNFLHRPDGGAFFNHRKKWKKRCLMMMEMWSAAWLCFKQMAPSRRSFAGCHY